MLRWHEAHYITPAVAAGGLIFGIWAHGAGRPLGSTIGETGTCAVVVATTYGKCAGVALVMAEGLAWWVISRVPVLDMIARRLRDRSSLSLSLSPAQA